MIATIRLKVFLALFSCVVIGIIAIPDQCFAVQKHVQVADSGNSEVTVSSTQWVNTSLTIKSGDTLEISARGSWSASENVGFTKPNGYEQEKADNFLNLKDIGTCSFCASTKAPYWGALIGYIGNNPPEAGSYTSRNILPEARRVFFVGSNFWTVSKLSGKLWLAFNDDAYSGYTGDNSGQVDAKVAFVTPPTKVNLSPYAKKLEDCLIDVFPITKSAKIIGKEGVQTVEIIKYVYEKGSTIIAIAKDVYSGKYLSIPIELLKPFIWGESCFELIHDLTPIVKAS